MKYVKILLAAYPEMEGLIRSEKEAYMGRCRNSAYFYEPTELFAEKLISKFESVNKLIELKRKLDVMFSRFSDEEKDLIMFKYAGKQPKKAFTFSLRTYFRRQIKLLKKAETFLGYLGIDDKAFEKDYLDIGYFSIMVALSKKRSRQKNEFAVYKNVLKMEAKSGKDRKNAGMNF